MAEVTDPSATLAFIEATFPWLSQLGLSVERLRDMSVEVAGDPNVMVAKIRQLPEYQQRFPAIRRENGEMRMQEGQYLQFETQARQLLRQYGIPESSYRNPSDLADIIRSEQDLSELSDRLRVYQAVRDAGDPIREAFYVYSGIDLSVDDLFEALVDENLGRQIQADYVSKTKAGLDYETFLNRTTEVALDRIAAAGGAVSGTPSLEQARQVIDVLYSNAGDDGATLSLNELLGAFEEAAIGAAATSAGLELPTKERIQEFRAAGVQRAQAQDAYLRYALEGRQLSANAYRAGQGTIDQERFEEGVFLGDSSATRALQTAQAYSDAIGRSEGGFRFEQSPTGDGFVQSGLK